MDRIRRARATGWWRKGQTMQHLTKRPWRRAVLLASVTIGLIAADVPSVAAATPIPKVRDIPALPGPSDGPFGEVKRAKSGTAPELESTQSTDVTPSVPGATTITQRPDLKGRTAKHVKELVDRRDQFATSWLDDDGRVTTVVSSEPVHYQVDGKWVPVDLTLQEEPARPGWFATTANEWSAEFGPVTAGGGGGVELTSADDHLRFAPAIGAPSIAPKLSKQDGHPVVTYPDAWPGVDVRYVVFASLVREEMVVHTRDRSSFPFSIDASALAGATGRPNAFTTAARGPLAMEIQAPTITDHRGDPVDSSAAPKTIVGAPAADAPSETGSRAATNPGASSQELVVSIDPAWLSTVSDDQLPLVVDPTVSVGNATVATSYESPANVTQNDLKVRAGTDGGNQWRSLIGFNYTHAGWASSIRDVQSAFVTMSYVTGSVATPTPQLYWASSPDFAGVAPGFGMVATDQDPGDDAVFDVTQRVHDWVASNVLNGGLGLAADSATTSYSVWDDVQLSIVEDTIPPAPRMQQPVTGTRVVTQVNPSFSYTPVCCDADADPLHWTIRIATGSDALSGTVAVSPDLSAATTTWTPPEGTLQDGQTYYWDVWSSDGAAGGHEIPAVDGLGNVEPPRKLVVDRRLSSLDASPSDSLGPITTNAVTGNGTVTVPTPTMQTVGGPVGVSLTYNTIVDKQGLLGTYFVDDAPYLSFDPTDEVRLQRVDPQVNFSWHLDAPTLALPVDHFLVRWTGYITIKVPSGQHWQLGQVSDDAFRAYLDNDATPESGALNDWTAGGATVPAYGGPTLNASSVHPIKIEYGESVYTAQTELWVRRVDAGQPATEMRVPSDWLTYAPMPVPLHWTLSAGPADAQYNHVRVTDSSITLYREDGTSALYQKNETGSFSPPEGEHDVVSLNSDGAVLVSSDDGNVYRFLPDGRLDTMRRGDDDRKPAVAEPTYDSAGRLAKLTDPVSGRYIQLMYAGTPDMEDGCPDFSADPDFLPHTVVYQPPDGTLCEIQMWDGTHLHTLTQLFYNDIGQLWWVRNQGNDYYGFAYTDGELTQMVDPLAADMARAGIIDTNDLYDVTYNSIRPGMVFKVRAPDPAVGVTRPEHSYEIAWANDADPTSPFTGGTTAIVRSASGSGPGGHTVTYDDQGRLTTDQDSLGQTTSYLYKSPTSDLVFRVQHPDGAKVDHYYDEGDREIIETAPYKGSPSSVPYTLTSYDEGLHGLAASWWSSAQPFIGAPVTSSIGVDPGGSGAITVNWGGGAPAGITSDAFSGRLTGDLKVDTSGSYTFGVTGDDKINVYVDDRPVEQGWSPGGPYPTLHTGAAVWLSAGFHRIRVDYADIGGAASLSVFWQLGAGSWSLIPGANLYPELGLVTSIVDPDGARHATTYGSISGGGVGPQHGLPTVQIDDPTSTNLQTVMAYEAPGSLTSGGEPTYLRPVSRTMPSGGVTSYTYYGKAERVANPCASGSSDLQSGMLKDTIGPDPDGAGPALPLHSRVVYDGYGRPVATASYSAAPASDPAASDWVCTTYDAKGRVTQVQYPAYGGQPARTVTTNYLWNGFPSATLVSDGGSSVGSMVDNLGRPTWDWAAFGDITHLTYDDQDQVTSTSSSRTGVVGKTFNDVGEVTEMKYNGATVANGFTYNPNDQLTGVTFPTGSGAAGNGTSGTFTYDDHGDLTSTTWKAPGGSVITSDAVARSNAGRYVDEAVDGTSHAGADFTYDGAGRLTAAYITGRTAGYAYAASGGCGVNAFAGKDTNRTLMATLDGAGPIAYTSYCYDNADRLTSSSDPTVGTITYDSHGNTTQIFGETHAYDSADRHVSTTKGGTTITYGYDAKDQLIDRVVNGAFDAGYIFSGLGDAPDGVINVANQLVETDLPLPGGALWTIRPTGGNVWSYPNVHGDIVASANQSGTKQGATVTYDPFGNTVGTTTPVDNSHGSFDYGYVGQHQRPTETQAGLQPTIEMGERQYSPLLGRFLEVDPVEGGSANNYDYVSQDPLNNLDLNGLCKKHKGLGRLRDAGCHAGNVATKNRVTKSGAKLAKNAVKHGVNLAAKGGKLAGRCALNAIACGHNIETAILPLVAGATVFATGVAFVLGGAPLIVGVGAAALGGYTTYVVGRRMWGNAEDFERL
jgi:RHS repeat-associated protein